MLPCVRSMPAFGSLTRAAAASALVLSCGRLGFDLLDPRQRVPDASIDPDGSVLIPEGGSAGGAGGSSMTGGNGGTLDLEDAEAGGADPMDATDAIDAVTVFDASPEAMDVAPDAPFPACTVSREWQLAFDSDPTLYDGDSD